MFEHEHNVRFARGRALHDREVPYAPCILLGADPLILSTPEGRSVNVRRRESGHSGRYAVKNNILVTHRTLLAVAAGLFATGALAADPIKVGVTIAQSPPGSVSQGTQVTGQGRRRSRRQDDQRW